MKFSYLKSVSPIELIVFVLFVLYIIFPVDMPYYVASYINSSLGMIVLLCVAIYLFIYATPILGVVFIFVAYELIRRSASITGRTDIIDYTPSQDKKDAEMVAMNPPQEKTLEETMVDLRAPIGKSQISEFVESEYKPVSDKTVNSVSLI